MCGSAGVQFPAWLQVHRSSPGFPTAYLRTLYELTTCTNTEGVSSVKMMILLLLVNVEPGPKPVMPQHQINLMLYHSMTALLLEFSLQSACAVAVRDRS